MERKQESSPKELLPIEKCQKCENGEPCTHGTKKPDSKSSTLSAWALGIVVLLFGLVMFGGLAHDAVRDHRLVSKGTQTVSSITDVEFGKCGSRKHKKPCAKPTLTYADESGKKYSTQGPGIRYHKEDDGSQLAFADTLYGNEYTLYYDPSNPETSVVEGEESPYWIIIFTLLPIAFGGLIVYAMADSAIRKRKTAESQNI